MRIEIGLFLVGALALSLTGCDDKKPDAKPAPTAATATAAATAHATAAPAKPAAPGTGW